MSKSVPATLFAVTSYDPTTMVDQINAAFRDIQSTLALLDGGFSRQQVTTNAVTNSNLALQNLLSPQSISSTLIADSAITTLKIAAAAVTDAQIASNAISSGKLVDGSVLSTKLADLAVTTAKLADDSITTAKLVDSAVTAAELAANAVTTTKITDDAITTAKIIAGAITTGKIAAGAVTANEIAANTITAAKIAAGTITATEIAVATITGAKIAAGTITASNIQALTITANEIAASTITGAKIAATTITAANIAAGTISANEIAAATITGAKIAALTITAGNIVAGTITGTQIAATTISASNIVSGTITATQIASATITGSNIAATTITGGNIAASTITSDKISVTSLSALSANLGTATIASGGSLSSGQTAYNTGTGFWFGNVSGTPKFSIGVSTGNYLTWDGTSLTLKGAITITNTIAAASVTGLATVATTGTYSSLTGVPNTTYIDSSGIYTGTITATQVTTATASVSSLAALKATLGGVSIDTGGYLKSGQTAYNTGVGFWLEYNAGTPRISIGNSAGNYLTWDGSALTIKGAITITNTIPVASVSGLATVATSGSYTNLTGTPNTTYINSGGIYTGTITASQVTAALASFTTLSAIMSSLGTVTIGTGGSLSSGQTAYNTGTGFWLEYNAGTPRFSLGNPSGNSLTWDGTNLTIKGSITVTNTIPAASVSGLASVATGGTLAAANVTGLATVATSGSYANLSNTPNTTYISGTGIYTGTLTAAQITAATASITSLSALCATLGSVTISTGGSLSSGQTAYNTGTGFWLEYNGGTPRFSLGSSASKLTWDGSLLTVTGKLVAGKTTISEVGGTNLLPVLYTGSQIAAMSSYNSIALSSWYSVNSTITTESSALDLACLKYNTTGPVSSHSHLRFESYDSYGSITYLPPDGGIRNYLRLYDGIATLWAKVSSGPGIVNIFAGTNSVFTLSDGNSSDWAVINTPGFTRIASGSYAEFSGPYTKITTPAGGYLDLAPASGKAKIRVPAAGLLLTANADATTVLDYDGSALRVGALVMNNYGIKTASGTQRCVIWAELHANIVVNPAAANPAYINVSLAGYGFSAQPDTGFIQIQGYTACTASYDYGNASNSSSNAVIRIDAAPGGSVPNGYLRLHCWFRQFTTVTG